MPQKPSNISQKKSGFGAALPQQVFKWWIATWIACAFCMCVHTCPACWY